MRSSSPSDFEASLRALIAPDPDGDIVDWLERNVKSVPYSPNPGPFRIESTPYLAPILRALQDPEVETVAVMGNVQSGKSMVVELWSAFVPARTPGPMLLLQDVDLNAQDWQQTRLRPLWEATPSTRDQISQTEKAKWHMTPFRRNTTWVLGADNERNLQRRSIRFLGGDEVWQWPRGHLKQALARRTAFTWQGKSVFVSQGAEEDHDFTELFNGTDRREWCFTCHKCGEVQPYDWAFIRYPDGAKKDGLWDFDEVRANTTYACRRCDHRHLDRNSVRAEMNATAKYVPMNPGAPKGRVGFHFNALAMQWGLSWGDLAVECIEAAQSFDLHADESKRKDFKMKRLALPWSDEPDDSGAEILPSSYRMEQDWAEEGRAIDGRLCSPPFSPEQIRGQHSFRLRFMAVDVQRKGYYFVIRSWSSDGKSRLIRWMYVDTWEELRREQQRLEVADQFVFVDSGDGPNVDEVYEKCATYGWQATKGSGETDFPWRVQTPVGVKIAYRPYKPAKVVQVGKRSCRLHLFSNLALKDALARIRRKGDHTYPEDCGDEYKRQMTSEHRTRSETGRPIWVQVGERANHLWDCEVIGLLPAMMARLIGRGKNKPTDEKTGVDKETPAPKD